MQNGLIFLGRCGIKYIDDLGIEYYIDGEMIIDKDYDFVVWSDTIQFYDDYLMEHKSENIIYEEKYDKNKKCIIGKFEYINKYPSNISTEKRNTILKRIKELSNGKIIIE